MAAVKKMSEDELREKLNKELYELSLNWVDNYSTITSAPSSLSANFARVLEPAASDSGSDSETLNALISSTTHFPTMTTSNLLRMKYIEETAAGRDELAAAALLHSQSIAFHHQVIRQCQRKLDRKQERALKTTDEKDMFDDDGDDEVESVEQIHKRSLQLHESFFDETSLRGLLSRLPPEWRVVQLNVQPVPETVFKPTKTDESASPRENFPLIITQLTGGPKPEILVSRHPAVDNGGGACPSLMQEFDDIMASHLRIYKQDVKLRPGGEQFDRKKYNRNREDVDDRLDGLLESISNKWLGYGQVLLQGKLCNEESEKEVDFFVAELLAEDSLAAEAAAARSGFKESQRLLLKRLVDGVNILTNEQIKLGLKNCGIQNTKIVQKLYRKLVEFKSGRGGGGDVGAGNVRHPVVLVLDREIQKLPWESLPCMAGQPATRIPSVPFLASLYEAHNHNASSVLKTQVEDRNIFFILNPEQNVPKTQDRLELPLKEMRLEGISGARPTLPQVQRALTENDAYMYIGHGTGSKLINSQELERLTVRAIPMLFGCGSASVARIGRRSDPLGAVHSYLIASAPYLLGFLWSVTDKDLDQWTLGFMKHWLGKEGAEDDRPDFLRAIVERRRFFQRTINRAATVVYGLPTTGR